MDTTNIFDFVESLLKESVPQTKHSTEKQILEFNLLRQLTDTLQHIKYLKEDIKGTIAVLQSIRLYTKFQHKGLFKPFMWMILKTLKENMNVDYVILYATLIDISLSEPALYRNEAKRLEKMYSKFGFIKKRPKTVNDDRSFMILNLKTKSFELYE